MKNNRLILYSITLLLVSVAISSKATTSYPLPAKEHPLDSNRAPVIVGATDVLGPCPNEYWSQSLGIMDPDGDGFQVSAFSSNSQVITSISLTEEARAYPNNYNLSFVIGTTSGNALIYISVTDNRGQSTTKTVRVSLKATRAYIVAQTNVSCNGDASGSATAMADNGYGGYTYSWNTTPVQTTASVSNLPGGTYVCTVKDNENCTVNTTVTIEEPSPINLSFRSRNLRCKGDGSGSATVTASGGVGNYSYEWSTNPPQYSTTINNLAAGTYTCNVRDNFGCPAQGSVTITEPSSGITARLLNQSPTNCSEDKSGTASVMATGGTGTISYAWNSSPVQTNPTAINLAAQEYTCTISDQSACSVEMKVSISAAFNFKTMLDNRTHVRCKGDSNGTATIRVLEGSGNYLYNWNTEPQQNTATASNLPPGTYICTTIDGNRACTAQDTVQITGPSTLLQARVLRVQQPVCTANGEIEASANGGEAPYTYNWQPVGGSSPAITNLGTGIYTCVVSDARGCTKNTETVKLDLAQAPEETRAIEICEGEVYVVGTTTYTESGTYIDTLRTSNGCDSLVLTSMLSTITLDATITVGATSLEANENAGTQYQWVDCTTQQPIPNATSRTFVPQNSGAYAVDVTKGVCRKLSACYPYTKTGSTAIYEKTHTGNLRFFPNPSNGTIFITATTNQVYLIKNQLGQIVMQGALQAQQPEQLDISNLANGMYYIATLGDSTQQQKLLIMK